MTSDGDCDSYLKLNTIPTLTNWDYANVTYRNVSTIHVVDPTPGYWYFGVFGYKDCTYTVSLDAGAECPNDCSHRGPCNGGNTCNCNPGYSGDYCQTRNAPLTNGAVDSGYVRYNSWNYYTYPTNSEDNLIVTLMETNEYEASDCDLYIKAGQNPTRFLYDYQEIGNNQNTSLSVNDPGQATWYIGVFGWSECSYSITAYESASCSDTSCSGHGACLEAGVCSCGDGWTGDDCQFALTEISNGQTITDTVRFNNWNYYNIAINSSALYVVLQEQASVGDIWLYVSNSFPTIRQYLYSDVQTNTNTHVISFQNNGQQAISFQIGVYGNPYVLPGQAIPYHLTAWSPNF